MTVRKGFWMAVLLAGCAAPLLSLKAADAPATNGNADVLTISVPGAVRTTILKETGGVEVMDFHREHDNGSVQFVAGVMSSDHKYDLTVDESGRLLSKNLSDEDMDAVAHSSGQVKPDALPEAVKAAVEKELHGGVIGGASVSYEVKAVEDQGEYNLKFAGDGTLLSKELDDSGK